MGMPALLGEGLSWRDVRLRALQTAPVQLGAYRREAAGARQGAAAEAA
jgi:phosphatidylinositol alpha-mannosyltransferase